MIQAGVLESRQGNGTYVITKDRFEANILNRLSTSKISEVHEIRISLEKEIVKLATLRRTNDDLKNIKRALDKNTLINESFEERSKADLEFHIAIAKASHNSIFYDLYKSISKYIFSSIELRLELTQMEEELILQLHTNLYEAILEKNKEKAEEIISKILKI